MDCSICFDAIAASTGSATLSCGHQFHLGCVARWLMTNESCPYCRHASSEHERVAQPSAADDDESEDDDMDDEDDRSSDASLDIPAFDDECHALWVLRETFDMLERGESINPAPAPAEPKPVGLLVRIGQCERHPLRGFLRWHPATLLEVDTIRCRQNQLDRFLSEDRGYESA